MGNPQNTTQSAIKHTLKDHVDVTRRYDAEHYTLFGTNAHQSRLKRFTYSRIKSFRKIGVNVRNYAKNPLTDLFCSFV